MTFSETINKTYRPFAEKLFQYFRFFPLFLMCVSGLAQSNNDGFELHLKKATQGDADSAVWLSRYYNDSKNTRYNTKESNRWLVRAAKLGKKSAIVQIGYDYPYIAASTFNCGVIKVSVATSCYAIDKNEGRPVCYTQHISLMNNGAQSNFFIFKADFVNDLMIANEAECLTVGATSWVIIKSTNFGNGNTCIDCEREDYFLGLKYIGSSANPNEIGKSIIPGYKLISPKMLEQVNTVNHTKNTQKRQIEINTYPLIK